MKNYNNFLLEWGYGKNKDFNGEYVDSIYDKYKYIGECIIDLDEVIDSCEEVRKTDIQNYVSIETIKKMFPIYDSFDFVDDWHIHIYKYDEYLIIQRSGYYYTFIKK